jgi:FAD/FMN-containing dehydrogenase
LNGSKEKLMAIVGSGNILDNPETLVAYARDQSFVPPMEPQFVVKPENVEEVQGIVKWANETGTPLVPVSSGPPRFYGDTVPSTPGVVIVDLSGMKKIIRINRRNRITIVEPGVTYSQLQPELAKEGLRLSTPLLPRANKSVIASLLERQPTMVPRYQFSILDPLRCLEVVWGDGNQFRTGEAGNQRSLEEAWKSNFAQVTPRGPGQTDFYKLISGAQGSMGIVTWASLKCEVLPELHKLFFVPAPRLDDLLDLAYRLLRFRFGDELLLLNGSTLASILGDSIEQMRTLKEKLPPWVILVGVAGRSILPRERVEFQEKDIREIARQFGLQVQSEVPGARDSEVLEAILNPSREPYWKLGYKGGCQDIFFMTTLDKTPQFVRTMLSSAETLNYPASDIGVYIQPVHQGASCHCEFSLPFDPNNEVEVARVKELYTRASNELLEQGAFFSRPYDIWADMVYKRDMQTTLVLKKVKEIFDPNNVMNPGKLCF